MVGTVFIDVQCYISSLKRSV